MPCLRPFEREGLCEVDEGALARRVGGPARHPDEPELGGDAHDASAAPLGHPACSGPAKEERAADVDGEDAVPVLHRRREGPDARIPNTRVVDQHVHRTDFALAPRHGRLDVVRPRHVEGTGHRTSAELDHFLGDAGRGVTVDVGDDHAGTRIPETRCEGAADALTGAGHESGPAGEREIGEVRGRALAHRSISCIALSEGRVRATRRDRIIPLTPAMAQRCPASGAR